MRQQAAIKEIIKRKSDPASEESRIISEIDGIFSRDLQKEANAHDGPYTARQLTELSGLSLKEINQMEKDGVIHSFKKDHKQYFQGIDVQIVMCGGKMSAIGFRPDRGFTPYFMKFYKDAFDRIAEEEGLITVRNLAREKSPQQIAQMMVEILGPMTELFDLLHKKSLIEKLGKYANEYREHMQGNVSETLTHFSQLISKDINPSHSRSKAGAKKHKIRHT